jgi:putative DNA primase/helicase
LTHAGAASISPGDDFSLKTDWAEILEPEGWKLLQRMTDGERLWVRPGKERRDGHSASTDYQGKPGLYVWSTSTGLDTETPLSKLFVYAHYRFSGDMSAAARDLVRRGFGERPAQLALPQDAGELDIPGQEPVKTPKPVSFSDVDNGERLWSRAKEKFRYVHEGGTFYTFNKQRWEPDFRGALVREWTAETREMEADARASDDVKALKWAVTSRNASRVNAAMNMMKSMDGATISVSEMDYRKDLLNLGNGELSLETGELQPHDPSHLMTRMFNANFDPNATAPHWDSFLRQVVPDEKTRKYIQRAVAYTLLGNADHRSFFIVYGPTGTGKSQFLSTLEHVFGDYGGSAAEGTFHPGQGSLTNDLHGLRNKRLITTSETADGASFNENLMKRLTGRDQIVSRELYQSNVTWTPECTIWIATNHPPRFNSDDNAIWRRAKLIPFLTGSTCMPKLTAS